MARTVSCYYLLSLHQITPKCGIGEINFVEKSMISILDMCLSCLQYIQLDMPSRQYHMQAYIEFRR